MRWKIIKRFSSRNIFGFTFQDVLREFPEKNRTHLASLLADMVSKGMLCRISRNIYHIIPFNANPESYMPDRYQIAKYLMQGEDYYIGFNSALRIQGLISLHAGRDFVVTKRQIRPSAKRVGGICYQFIQHDVNHFFGFCSMWINQLEKAMVSDLEKTIVDMVTKPQLCGGIIEVGNALFQARDRTDRDKLFYYFARNINMSAKKRFLFLTETLDLEWTTDHDRMMKELGTSFSLLDPATGDYGRKRSRFRLKINVEPNRIKEIILNN